ncbi:hypothetical protein Llac01_03600 [Leuconostoc lactis]|uniref:glycosyltransferase n=1 Tax=Leuconostoc lactis TaxID=1246 RepID=UPI001141ECAE|nr:glycosyltransferase [Leuconostoc lactis]GEB41020.1 hypothetical protein LLA04_14080 [Leuconostoc lactis]GLY44983.1 hypothetical protein Llac01_03600 [Leuconostoc lactis]
MNAKKNNTTIILATYNGEKYIIDQLQSLLNQSYKQFNVIIRDDGSNDRTAELVSDFIKQHRLEGQWNFKINEKNKGWRKNFVDMLKSVDSEYVFFSDQDDLWRIKKLESMIEILQKNEDIGVLVSDYNLFGGQGGNEKVTKIDEVEVSPGLYKIKKNIKNLTIRRDGCAFAIRDSAIPSILNVYSHIDKDGNGLPQAHDLATWIAGLLSDSLYHTHEKLIDHRIHETSTWSIESKKLKKDNILIVSNLLAYYSSILNLRDVKKADQLKAELVLKISDLDLEKKLIEDQSLLAIILSVKHFSSIKRYIGCVKRYLL